MLKSLLIGLDGSPYSHAAAELGIDWARRFDALAVGLGVVDAPGITQGEMVPIGGGAFKERSDEARVHRATRQVEQFLEQFSLACAAADVSSKVLEDVGSPADVILREAQRYDAVLLGQQTHFRFATQEEPCDTLTRVLKATPRPVVAVPRRPPAGTSIVVAYDGSLQAARALQAFQGTGLAQAFPVHVVSAGPDGLDAARHADRAVEFLGFHGIRATPHPVATADAPAKVLLDHVGRLDARLLVLGAYGRSAVWEFFLGSVTRTLLADCPVPLFLYH